MGAPFLQCGWFCGCLPTSKPQLLQVAQGVSSQADLPIGLIRLFQWGVLSGRRVPCGDGDWALPLLAEALGISMLHLLVKLLHSSYGTGLTEPLVPTSCTAQISCPQDHA